MTVEQAFSDALAGASADHPIDQIVVAVSGGGDSMALLHLAAAWARGAGVAVSAVTVDHGLRPEAAGEAAQVAQVCAGLDVPHDTLRWGGWDGQGNLQAAARTARYDLIAQTAPEGTVILIGHTADDAAETFLMRLARGSGVDGLTHMRTAWEDRGHRWLRPLLTVRRAALREWLTARGIDWIEDPSNDDPTYDRVRIRQALSLLAPLGIDTARLTTTAHAMSEAREALEYWAARAAREVATIEAGDVLFDHATWSALPGETRDRLLAHAIGWVSGATYRPRRAALTSALTQIGDGGRSTLGGCLLVAKGGTLRIGREPAAVAGAQSAPDALWDNRWRLTAPGGTDLAPLSVQALGTSGLAQCPGWRDTGLPRETLLASPAVWSGETLVAAPLAGHANGWQAEVSPSRGDFFTSLLSH